MERHSLARCCARTPKAKTKTAFQKLAIPEGKSTQGAVLCNAHLLSVVRYRA